MTITMAIAGFTLFTLQACIAPVRTELFPQRKDAQPAQHDKTVLRPPDLRGVETSVYTPQDTTYIDYDEASAPGGAHLTPDEPIAGMAIPPSELVRDFENALADFDDERFEQACASFDAMAETLPENDSLRFEALFMTAECALINDRLLEANRLLNSLYRNARVPDPVLERVMLRLGQSYCLLGDFAKADDIFRKFSVVYPNSIFSALASCDAVMGEN